MPLDMTFWAINPYQEDMEFAFRVQPVGRENLYHLARAVRAEPIATEARFVLRDAGAPFGPNADREPRDPFPVKLGASERRPMHLRISLGTLPAEGQFAGFEILQYQSKEKRLVGSLGVVVLAPDTARS